MSNAILIAKQNRDMLNSLIKQTEKLASVQVKANRVQSNYTKSINDDTNAENENTKALDRRTKSVDKAIKKMESMGKQFELLNYKSLQAFRKEGGNVFEYFDMLLTSSKEQVKILGIEAGTARRVLYGFFPPGMFSLVSKLSTGMKFAGGVVRKFGGESEEAGKKQENMFTKIGKGFKLLTGFRKKAKIDVAAELGETVKKIDFSKIDKAIKQQEATSLMFGDSSGADAKDKHTLGFKRKAHKKQFGGNEEQEDFFSTALSASPEALLKNLETVEKAIKASKKKEFKKAKKAAKKEVGLQIIRLNSEKSRINAATKYQALMVKKANDLEEKLKKEAFKNVSDRIFKEEKLRLKAAGKTGFSMEREAFQNMQNIRDSGTAVEDELDTLQLAPEFQEALDRMHDAIKSTQDREKELKAAQTQLDTLVGIKQGIIEDNKVATKSVTKREKDAKTADKARKKAFKQGETAQKWRNLKDKIDKIRETKLGPLKESFKMFMGGVLKFMLLFLAGLIVLQAIWPMIQKVIGPVLQVAMVGLEFIIEGVRQLKEGVVGLFNAITGGDLMDIVFALGDIIIGFGKIIWGLITIVFGSLLTFIGGIFMELLYKARDWFMSLGNNLKSVKKVVVAVLTIAGMIVAAIYGAPILLIAGIGILLYKVADYLMGLIPGMANGGVSAGGLTMVGEKGPELVNLPKNSRVHSNSNSKQIVSGSSNTNNFNITINARDTSDGELRRIADKIGTMINSKINRSTSASTMR